MFLPSERVYNEMKHEPAGFWPVPINDGREFAFVLQVPLHMIKAVSQQCPVKLMVAAAGTPLGDVLCTSFSIADDPSTPFLITGVHRYAEEHQALREVLRSRKCLVVFFDELSRPVARASCSLTLGEQSLVCQRAIEGASFYQGSWSAVLAGVLDELEGLLDPTRAVQMANKFHLECVALTLSDFETIKVTALGEHEHHSFRLEDQDEGYVLEQGAWHLLESFFHENAYLSPQVEETGKRRELTDILTVSDAGLCFVEAKAVAVLSTDPLRPTERRVGNVQKQVKKGLAQLPGAMRSITRGLPITTKAGAPIRFPDEMLWVRHGIIMVSELLPGVDWKDVAKRLISESRSHDVMLHVLDLLELRRLVAVSQKKPLHFMMHLIHRFDSLCKHKTAFMRSAVTGPSLP